MQPTYAGLEQYNTIEGNISVDHFPAPPTNLVHHKKHNQSLMTA